jgi:hypothetical protein
VDEDEVANPEGEAFAEPVLDEARAGDVKEVEQAARQGTTVAIEGGGMRCS